MSLNRPGALSDMGRYDLMPGGESPAQRCARCGRLLLGMLPHLIMGNGRVATNEGGGGLVSLRPDAGGTDAHWKTDGLGGSSSRGRGGARSALSCVLRCRMGLC